MTVKEAAKRLEISLSLCYALCEQGRLGHHRIGGAGRRGKIIITEADIETYIKSLRSEPKPLTYIK